MKADKSKKTSTQPNAKSSTNTNNGNSIEILYDNKKIITIPINSKTTVNDIKAHFSSSFNTHIDKIELSHNNQKLNDKNKLIMDLLSKNSKTSSQLKIDKILSKFKFYQFGNDETFFDFDFDIINTSIDNFQQNIFNFFKNKMNEINYNLNSFEFFQDNKEDKKFFDMKNKFHTHFNNNDLEHNFYFLMKDQLICFYKKISEENNINNIKENEEDENIKNNNNKKEEIQLRANVSDGKIFKVLIQTYNHIIKEIQVFPEMTILQLKEEIENNFLVRKEYQELLYLVYKLNDDTKLIKDYYIRPNGIIFLRGFYFPIIFVDYYEKKNKFIININIAEQIRYIIDKIIFKLNLEKDYKYRLIFNGHELDEESFLIDYNIQKMQIIYFK